MNSLIPARKNFWKRSGNNANYGTVDFHAHPVTAAFRESLSELGIDPIQDDGFPLPAWSAETHLDFMREAGIAYTVLSIPTPHIHNGDDKKSCEAARIIALDMLRMVADDSHIVYGSDFPHSPAKVIAEKKRHFDANRKYDGLRDKIYRENALALLHTETEE